MVKIHNILEEHIKNLSGNGQHFQVSYLAPEDETLTSPLPDHVILNKVVAPDQIGHSTFLKWKLDDNDVRTLYKDIPNFRATIVKDRESNNSFILLPVYPHEGNVIDDKINMLKCIIKFVNLLGIDRKLKVCVLSSTKNAWAKHDNTAYKLFREAQIFEHNIYKNKDILPFIVDYANGEHSHPSNHQDCSFEIEEAVKHYDIIIPSNGPTGHSLIRSLRFLSKDRFEILSIPWFINYEQIPTGEGSFKKETNSDNHIKSAAVWQYLKMKHKQL
ncbi:hypothetical protein HXX01_02520 [Candidatus Nomurabacteria bacterium]|nr:hypothetical protein [Candidatus Nomurabacteria bacterium]